MDYTEEKKKEFLPFATAWREQKTIMLSEISPSVTEKTPYNLTSNCLMNKIN